MHSPGEADTLVRALQDDSIDAFDALYATYHQAVYRNICKLIHRHDIAEDILQDVFMTLWLKRNTLDPARSPANWLFVVSYNKALHWIRKDLLETKALLQVAPLLAEEEIPYSEQFVQSQLQAIQNAAGQLPLRKRQAFQLCRVEGRSYEEAGAILGISSETVKEYVKTSARFIRHSLVNGDPSIPGLAALGLFIVSQA